YRPLIADNAHGLLIVDGEQVIAVLLGQAGHFIQRRAKVNQQAVGARLQLGLYLHPPLPEHVVGVQDRRAIQCH
nr:hypothetical protein [Tanacetum cinerariifolium]